MFIYFCLPETSKAINTPSQKAMVNQNVMFHMT